MGLQKSQLSCFFSEKTYNEKKQISYNNLPIQIDTYLKDKLIYIESKTD